MASSHLPFVLVSHTLPEEWLSLLENRCRLLIGPETTISPDITPKLQSHIAEVDGMLTMLTARVDEALLNRAPRLRVVSNMAVGVNNIDVASCTRRGILVGNTPGVVTQATADLTLGLLLAIARRLLQASAEAREGNWKTWSPVGWLGVDLKDSILGIIGMGEIGQAVSTRARAFGMRIIYVNRTQRPGIDANLGATQVTLEELLHRSDFVCVHVPLTLETRHLINMHTLRLMKPTAFLINVARGGIVDTKALIHALQEKWIAGAALDVTDPEPLPASDLLYSIPNCLIVPHIGTATYGTRKRMAEMACRNLLAGLDGLPMPHCFNLEALSQRNTDR